MHTHALARACLYARAMCPRSTAYSHATCLYAARRNYGSDTDRAVCPIALADGPSWELLEMRIFQVPPRTMSFRHHSLERGAPTSTCVLFTVSRDHLACGLACLLQEGYSEQPVGERWLGQYGSDRNLRGAIGHRGYCLLHYVLKQRIILEWAKRERWLRALPSASQT